MTPARAWTKSARTSRSLRAAGLGRHHYDATKYGYDDMGRRRRTKEAHGTITRTVFDTRGNPIERWTGTNDNGFAGGEQRYRNMVKVEETTFDGGSAGGNGYVTKRTLFIQDNTTGKRETTYYNDARGRVIAVVNPTAPHTVNEYDNLGRVIATAQFSSSSGLNASSDPPRIAGDADQPRVVQADLLRRPRAGVEDCSPQDRPVRR
jgi:YD repeat-containing protein